MSTIHFVYRALLFFFFMTRPPPRSTPLSLHDALPIYRISVGAPFFNKVNIPIGLLLLFLTGVGPQQPDGNVHLRSEEHTSELQSPCNLVCRLLLEKKNRYRTNINSIYRTTMLESTHRT